MLKLRLFERDGMRVWLCGKDEVEGLRELGPRIGHLPCSIDWDKTAATCRVVRGEFIEIDLICAEGAAEEGTERLAEGPSEGPTAA